MSPRICPCMPLSTGVKFIVFGDAVCSIVLGITAFFALVGLLVLSEEIPVDAGLKTLALFGAIFLGALTAAQLWAANILYKYTNGSNQNNRGLWQWLLVTTVIIIWFLLGFIEAIRESKEGVAMFMLLLIVYKVYGVLVVAAFQKTLTGQETTRSAATA